MKTYKLYLFLKVMIIKTSFLICLSYFIAACHVTKTRNPVEEWKRMSGFVGKTSRETIPPNAGYLLEIGNFMQVFEISWKDEKKKELIKQQFKYGDIVMATLTTSNKQYAGKFNRSNAPYNPDFYVYSTARRKLLCDAETENYTFFTVRMKNEGKNEYGYDCSGRTTYMFLFFDDDDECVGYILAMK
jgi:hypothetical protein